MGGRKRENRERERERERENVEDINMVEARKNLIGFAEQEPCLLNDKIMYNLTFNE